MAARQLAAAKYPAGAESFVHVPTATGAYYMFHYLPDDAAIFLRTLPFERPPLVYLTTAALLSRLHTVWAYHLTILGFAALFAAFYLLAARRLTRRTDLAAVGLLAVFANPEWIAAAASYNLAMAGLAATVVPLWVLLSRRESLKTGQSLLFGLLAGALALAEPTAVLVWAPAAAAVVVFHLVGLRGRAALRTLLFCAAASGVMLWWYGPQVPAGEHWWGFLAKGDGPGGSWHFPLRAALLRYGGLPLLAGFAAAAVRARWREIPFRAWLPLIGAAAALAVFAAAHAKGTAVSLGAYAVLTLFALAVFDIWQGKARDIVVYSLLGLYGVLAFATWFPALTLPVEIASFGSAKPPEVVNTKPYFWDEKVADAINSAIDGRERCPAMVIDADSDINYGNVEARLMLAKPFLALMLPLRQPVQIALRLLNDACFLLAMQKKVSISLAVPEPSVEPDAQTVEASVANVMNLVESKNQWIEIARVPIKDRVLAIYKNNERTAKSIGRGTPDSFFDYYLLNYTTDNLRAFSRHSRRLLRIARYGDAFDHFQMALEKQPGNVAAYEGLLDAAARMMGPAKEAPFLAGVVVQHPPASILLRVVRRLHELETSKGGGGQFERWAIWVLDNLAPGEAGRGGVVAELLKFYLTANDVPRATNLVDREIPQIPDAELTATLWNLAEIAYFRRQNALAGWLYGQLQTRPNLTVRQRSLTAIRLGWVRGERPPTTIGVDKIASPDEARDATKYLVNESHRLRLAGKSGDALLMLGDSERWLEGCGVCLDEVALEKARDYLAFGDSDGARRQLREVRVDPDLRQIARELLAAHKTPSRQNF